jgi:hypothetical protein
LRPIRLFAAMKIKNGHGVHTCNPRHSRNGAGESWVRNQSRQSKRWDPVLKHKNKDKNKGWKSASDGTVLT